MRVVVAVALIAGCSSAAAVPPPPAPPAPVPLAIVPAPDLYSNIEPRDYVGPDACGDCHDVKHAHWSKSLHAAMNRLAAPGAIRGDFAGATVAYDGGTARFDRVGGAYLMTLARAGATHRYRVTRTIGSRYLQEYVGVEEGGDGTELRLPWGYWMRERRWFPGSFYDSWDGSAFDPFRADPAPWADRCAWCHNTYPFALRAIRSDALGVGHGMEQWLALDRVRDHPGRLPVDQLVTVGISCESCHGGGRAHADDGMPIRFVPASPALHRRPGAPDLSGGRTNPVVVDAICAQCHSTPAPRYPDGAAVRNSSEALDLAASQCTGAKCTDCHDPHTAGPGPGAVDPPRALAACARCHPDQASAAHARHATATCLDCHMPRIVEGVSAFVRTHRISSPSDQDMLAAGAPNACNLCHLDRSLGWTLDALEAGWGRRIEPRASWGPLDVPMGPAWLAGPVKTTRIVAAAAYARARDRAALPALLAVLDDPSPFFRMWTLFAIEDLLGRRLERDEYDALAPAPARARQIRRMIARWRAPSH